MLYLPLINLLWLSFWIPVVYMTDAFPQVKDFYREATPTRRPLENLHLESIREYLESVWEMPIMPSSEAEDFEMDGVVLGSGWFGTVRLTRHIRENKLYAVKSQMLSSNSLAEVQFMQAARNNSHTVQMHSYFWDEAEATQYTVMDYYSGGTLLDLLNRVGAFNEDEVRFYLAQMIIAVDMLHRARIMHHDIKPDNILVGDDGYLRLADFGISSLVSAYNPTTSLWDYASAVDWWQVGRTTMDMIYAEQGHINAPIQYRSLLSLFESSKANAKIIKAHPFFFKYSTADWDAIERKTFSAPFSLEYNKNGLCYDPTRLNIRRKKAGCINKTIYNVNNFRR
ncbi:protein kinase domain-containing protein [Ditylenchus destructor]|uniref:non-specific serine/threonine protein kinase n=1 Tax=Ditylenchus destructor TaxID=166010 RepID=A0AAD4NEJ3_9BILA|nr:protein kinase domain-containing protein [Ditylenchus destructor]